MDHELCICVGEGNYFAVLFCKLPEITLKSDETFLEYTNVHFVTKRKYSVASTLRNVVLFKTLTRRQCVSPATRLGSNPLPSSKQIFQSSSWSN